MAKKEEALPERARKPRPNGNKGQSQSPGSGSAHPPPEGPNDAQRPERLADPPSYLLTALATDPLPAAEAERRQVEGERREAEAAAEVEELLSRTAVALRYPAGQAEPNGPAAAAGRIVEAAWLAMRRRDGRALQEPDRWARSYLDEKQPDEQLSGVKLAARVEAIDRLHERAGWYLAQLRTLKTERAPSLAYDPETGIDASETAREWFIGQPRTAETVARAMAHEAMIVAPWLPVSPRDNRFATAIAEIAERMERAHQEAEDSESGLDAEGLVRATLDALGLTGPALADALRYRGQRKTRRRKRKRHRNI